MTGGKVILSKSGVILSVSVESEIFHFAQDDPNRTFLLCADKKNGTLRKISYSVPVFDY